MNQMHKVLHHKNLLNINLQQILSDIIIIFYRWFHEIWLYRNEYYKLADTMHESQITHNEISHSDDDSDDGSTDNMNVIQLIDEPIPLMK